MKVLKHFVRDFCLMGLIYEISVINSRVKSRERKVLEGQDSKFFVYSAPFTAKQNGELFCDSTCAKIAQIVRDGKKGKKLL